MSDSLRPHGLQHHQASLSFTISWTLLRFMSIELVMPSNHLILCRPLLLLPSVGFRAHPKSRIISSQDPKPITSAKNFFQRKPHSEIPGGHESFGGHASTHSIPPSWSPGHQPFSLNCFTFKHPAPPPTQSPRPHLSYTSSPKLCSMKRCSWEMPLSYRKGTLTKPGQNGVSGKEFGAKGEEEASQASLMVGMVRLASESFWSKDSGRQVVLNGEGR